MPGWLIRSDYVRSFEQVGEFLRLASRAATVEEAFQHACDILRRVLEADVVVLWKLDRAREQLEAVTAAPPDWQPGTHMALDAFPELGEALAELAPRWVEKSETSWQPFPLPLLDARSALVLPVAARGRAHGCVLAGFTRATPSDRGEEREAALALVDALGLMLESEALREQGEAQQRWREARLRVEADLQRSGLGEAGLEHVAAGALELSGAEVVGVFQRQPTCFQRVSAAGAVHLLPAELPLGESVVLPWQRALAEGTTVGVSPAELVAGLGAWLPELAHAHLELRVVPLGTSAAPVGVLLVGSRGAGAAARAEELGFSCLAPFGAAALESARARRLQEQAQRRYLELLDEVPVGVLFLDGSGRVLATNQALLRFTGYAAEELEQRPLAQFLDPADWQPLCAWLQSRSGGSYQGLVRWQAKTGARLAFDLALRLLPEDADPAVILGMVSRPAEVPAGEAEVSVDQARLAALLDSIHEGVWLLAPDGTVQFANHRLAQLFGVNIQQLGPGLPQARALDLLKGRFRHPEAVLDRWGQLNARPEEMFWDELELLEPRRRVVERFARPLFDDQQRLVGRLEIYRDITAQRLLEGKVLQRERLAAVGQLVSGIAHELNNPLTTVIGYAQLLGSDRLPAELQEKARRLQQEAERAGRIVKNLLLFARGAGAERQPVDLSQLLDQTLSLRAYELKVENIQVVRDYAAESPRVVADPHQLQQVFLNILLNAEQAIRSQRGHGRITVRTTGRREAESVQAEIANDGPPIPSPFLPHLFEPFFTTKPAEEGTGLGLAISQAIVKEHGGDVRAQNLPAGGVVFIVELPAQPLSASLPALAPVSRAARAPGKRGHKILVVDDEPAVAELIADALRQQGYAVRVHTESRRALAEAFAQPFDLAICDIRMPELDGQAFHRALCEQHPSLAGRLLFTTGDTLARETAEFLERVRLPYLPKPFRVEELRRRVRDLLVELESASANPASAPANA